jgi:ABC-type nitrate/sulfonate/bicarbonate transport system substrate-binding protein
MTKWTRWGLGAAALAALASALFAAGCGDDDDDGGGGELTDVSVMLDWTPNTNHSGIFIARDKGYYEEAGLKVNIIEPASTGVEQAVAAGAAQFGISVQESVIPARAQGIPVVSIAAIIEHNTSSLMVLAEKGVTSPGDLSGMSYGGFGGALEEPLIKQLVECEGGDPDSIKFVNVGNVDYLVGMEQGNFDFVWIFDGWDGIRAQELTDTEVTLLHFIDYVDCIPDWYTPLIITSEKMADEDSETVEKFMEATARGYREAMEDPAAAVEALMSAAPESDRELVTLSAEYLASRYAEDPDAWGRQDEGVWTRFEEFLRDAGITDEEIDVSEAFTNDFLPGD